MATNQKETADAICPVKSSPDKFYNFFKYNLSELVKLAPAIFNGTQILQGEDGKVGCIRKWEYNLGGVPLTATVQLVSVDDAGKALAFSFIEGDVLLLYKSFVAAFAFTEGLAKCTLTYEKTTPLSPPPDAYVALYVAIFTLVDFYLLTT